jgi:hypothetical protein
MIIGRRGTVKLLDSKNYYPGEGFKSPDKSIKVLDPPLK